MSQKRLFVIRLMEPDLFSIFFWGRPALCTTAQKNLLFLFFVQLQSDTAHHQVSGADARGAIGVRRAASRAAQPRRLRIEIVL